MQGRTLSIRVKRAEAGRGLLLGWIGIPSPILASHLAQEGFDGFVIDMQHGQVDLQTAASIIGQIALAGKATLVRIPVGNYAAASGLLDIGAAGIIAPMINSAADARALVAFTKFPPVGERSFGPGVALTLTGQTPANYLAEANGTCLAIPMVETKAAVDNLDEILATDGVDGVLVGMSDLSIALSKGRELNPRAPDVTRLLPEIVARCKAHGKLSFIAAANDRGRELLDLGFDCVSAGTDVSQLRDGARRVVEASFGR